MNEKCKKCYYNDVCDKKTRTVKACEEKWEGWISYSPIPDQSAKADAGKPHLTKVPRQIIWDIAKVRDYGFTKYGEQADHWDDVEVQRYRDAAFRHFLRYLDNPKGTDEESGLTHLAHLACNIAFLCEMEKGE